MTNKKQNKKDLGEVMTPPETVKEMLNALPTDSWNEDKTFIDESAGDGNFLVEILIRKLKLGHDPTKAISTIYGVEIQQSNVDSCRARLLHVLEQYIQPTQKQRDIINQQIVCADSLKYSYEFK
jgi:type I restriction-modification system DNA methylase subunit